MREFDRGNAFDARALPLDRRAFVHRLRRVASTYVLRFLRYSYIFVWRWEVIVKCTLSALRIGRQLKWSLKGM